MDTQKSHRLLTYELLLPPAGQHTAIKCLISKLRRSLTRLMPGKSHEIRS